MPNLETKYQHIGILAAIPEELGSIVENLKNTKVSKFGDMEITSGEWISKNEDKIYYWKRHDYATNN